MSIVKDSLNFSIHDETLCRKAIAHNLRLDGRQLLEYRDVQITLSQYGLTSSAIVRADGIYISCIVRGDLIVPMKDRANEGVVTFSVNMPLRSSSGSISEVEVTRLLERTIKEGETIDLESLCVLTGEKVWQLKCVVDIVDGSGGSGLDYVCFAVVGALRAFRKPEVVNTQNDLVETDERKALKPASSPCITVSGLPRSNNVKFHTSNILKIQSVDEHEPLPLSMHHTPFSVSFAVFEKSGTEHVLVADPTGLEECTMLGRINYAVNGHKELCGVFKLGDFSVPAAFIVEGSQLAYQRALVLNTMLTKALIELETALKQVKEQRLQALRMKMKSYTDVLSMPAESALMDVDEPVLQWNNLHQSVVTKSEAQ